MLWARKGRVAESEREVFLDFRDHWWYDAIAKKALTEKKPPVGAQRGAQLLEVSCVIGAS